MSVLDYLHNVAELLPMHEAGYQLATRIPESTRLALNTGAQERALDAAAVEFRCVLADPDSEQGGSLLVFVESNEPQRVELYMGDYQLWTFLAGPGVHDIGIPSQKTYPWLAGEQVVNVLAQVQHKRFAPHLMRVCFPHAARVGFISATGNIKPADSADLPRSTLLTYGSSITQGMSSLSAGGAYAPRLAAALDMDHLNLGLAGSAHCESAIADHIAARQDWTHTTLEMGINILGIELADFESRVAYMVKTIGGKHQTRPVYCLDMFRHFSDLPDADAVKAASFRAAVKNAVAEYGGPQTHYISCKEFPCWQGLTADILHPSERGMEEMATALASEIQMQR